MAQTRESTCNSGDLGLIPGLGSSPGEGNGDPFQYSCLEKSINGGAWWLESMGTQRAHQQILSLLQASLVAQMINTLPAMQETFVQLLDGKDPWRR